MSSAPRTLPRRTVLAVSGTALLAAAAACSADTPATSSSSAPAGSIAASTAASSSAQSSAPSSAATSAASSAAPAPTADPGTPTSAASAAPTGTPLASVADIEAAGAIVTDGPDGPVLLAASSGSVVGHSAICTHQGCPIAASGACPCHGSKFDVVTGAVLNPPAQQPLPEFAVTVADGQVYAG